MTGRGVASRHGSPQRGARVSLHEARPDQARPGGSPRFRRQPTGSRTSSRRGRIARRSECGLLHPPRTRRPVRRLQSVLDSLARALQLDKAETSHLFDLARTASASPVARTSRRRSDAIRPSIQRLLDAITEAPALIRNNYFDYVAANRLGHALYSPVFAESAPNSARFAFLNPAARDFYIEWDQNTKDLVATMRGGAGRHPMTSDSPISSASSPPARSDSAHCGRRTMPLPPQRSQEDPPPGRRRHRAHLRSVRPARRSGSVPVDLHSRTRLAIGRRAEASPAGRLQATLPQTGRRASRPNPD